MATREEIPPDDGDVEGSSPSTDRFEAIGQSKAFLDFQDQLRRVAPVERPVLLLGERGTGKEMAARRLHFLSKRWGQPFVTLNCAALAPSLIESELFGHEEGAFTGARRRRVGRFEAADGGTLFLDEISLIPIEAQEKILRVVEYGSFERVGGTRPIQADVRIVGATNSDLSREAERGSFKRDLLDRLSFEVLFVPPLRKRAGDILLLAEYFAARMAFELGRGEMPQFSAAAAASLRHHPWPGNVRELKNVAERAVYRSDGPVIDTIEFDPFRSPWTPATENAEPVERAPAVSEAGEEVSEPGRISADDNLSGLADDISNLGNVSLPSAIQAVELHFLRRALKLAKYNQRVAAEALGLTYHQFRGLYRKYVDIMKSDGQE